MGGGDHPDPVTIHPFHPGRLSTCTLCQLEGYRAHAYTVDGKEKIPPPLVGPPKRKL